MSKKPKILEDKNQKAFDFEASKEISNSRAKIFQFKLNESRGGLSVSSDFLDRVLARSNKAGFDLK